MTIVSRQCLCASHILDFYIKKHGTLQSTILSINFIVKKKHEDLCKCCYYKCIIIIVVLSVIPIEFITLYLLFLYLYIPTLCFIFNITFWIICLSLVDELIQYEIGPTNCLSAAFSAAVCVILFELP